MLVTSLDDFIGNNVVFANSFAISIALLNPFLGSGRCGNRITKFSSNSLFLIFLFVSKDIEFGITEKLFELNFLLSIEE